MSTYLGNASNQRLNSAKDLSDYFQRFAKATDAMQVGLEAEFFGVNALTGKAIPYSGPEGVEAFLRALCDRFAYQPILEKGFIIGLSSGELTLALEPGGQIELNSPPVSNVFGIEDQLQKFIGQIHELQDQFPNVALIAAGFHPFSKLSDIEWVPKKRYAIMSKYLETRGTQSHDMMKRTATNQVSVDYTGEENAMASLRVVLALTSIVTALFANSPISEGQLNGFMTRRLDVWNHMDPDRSGLLAPFIRKGMTFQHYLDYLLDMPMVFIVRDDQWIPFEGIPFRTFLEKGHKDFEATLGDFELHLSTAFPEARLKQYLEIRGADCQHPDLIPAIAAFWKGLLYRSDAREAAWDLVAFASEEERIQLHLDVPKRGLQALLGTQPILPIACELVEISCRSLFKQKTKQDKRDECMFLDRIREKITRPGKSPAETLIDQWESGLNRDPVKLVRHLAI